MKPLVYISLPEYPVVLFGESKEIFIVNLDCSDVPLVQVPTEQLPRFAESGPDLLEALRAVLPPGR